MAIFDPNTAFASAASHAIGINTDAQTLSQTTTVFGVGSSSLAESVASSHGFLTDNTAFAGAVADALGPSTHTDAMTQTMTFQGLSSSSFSEASSSSGWLF